MTKYIRPTSRQDGVALVLVLAMLVLMSALLVAFVTSAGTENSASKVFAQGLEARQAAESAVNLVIAQIRQATEGDGERMTWASQPGAITTFGRGGMGEVYKLYSAEEMKEDRRAYRPEEDAGLDPSNPTEIPEGYVDLNEPVMVPAPGDQTGQVEPRFPIVNPYGSFAYVGGKFDTSARPTRGKEAIEGFRCNAINDPSGRKDINGQTVKVLPMPVKWIYQLKDGTMVGVDDNGKIRDATVDNPPVARVAFWTDDDSCRLNINTASEGTYWDTPIVSSFQETGNIDGGGGVVPGPYLNHSVAQPAKNEYQRFPGHPATTSLSPALRWMFTKPPFAPPKPNDADLLFKEAIYRMAPRIHGGDESSRAGTFNVKMNTTWKNKAQARTWDNERLYATVDEYLLRPDRTSRDEPVKQTQMGFMNTATPPVPVPVYDKEVANPEFTADNLEKIRFFLTAHSRAPELNLLGKPRIGVWPVHEEPVKRTAFDELMAFCSTIGGPNNQLGKFFVLRRNPNSAVDDFAGIDNSGGILQNQRVYKYMQTLTDAQIPFLSSTFLAKYGAADRDQILTQIFDYIRCTNLVDTSVKPAEAKPLPRPAPDTDPDNTRGEQAYPLAYTRYYWSGGDGAFETSPPAYASGQVTPIRIPAKFNPDSKISTKGFGRFPTLAEACILFYPQTVGPRKILRAVMIFDMFLPAQGFPGLSERYSMRVRPLVQESEAGVEGFKVYDGTTRETPLYLEFPKDAANSVEVDAYTAPVGRVFIPFRGFANQFLIPGTNYNDSRPKTFGDSPSLGTKDRTKYPFYSRNEGIEISKGSFLFDGGSLEVTIYDRPFPKTGAKGDTGLVMQPPRGDGRLDLEHPQIVQQFRIFFPPVDQPIQMPTSVTPFPQRLSNGITERAQDYPVTTGARAWVVNGDGALGIDVTRSVEAGGVTRGDHRLVAANVLVDDFKPDGAPKDEDQRFFTKREDKNRKYNSTARNVHGLRMSRGAPYRGETNDGFLVKGAQWRTPAAIGNAKPPRVPWFQYFRGGTIIAADDARSLGVMRGTGTKMYLGDWDRGLSKNMSGAFINKADEGNTNFEPGRGDLGIPYFLGFSGFSEVAGSLFSPNRLMPSSGMFGSLPSRTGVGGGEPRAWETLLFRPNDLGSEHPGGETPADHYLMDLFQMPVVEPYAISEPLSSAGKINLNYPIAPFGYVRLGTGAGAVPYIERKTAMHGLLKAVKVLCVPTNARWAGHEESPTSNSQKYRYDIDIQKTLDQVDERLYSKDNDKGLFKSASEICEVPLYPQGLSVPTTANAWDGFWKQNPLTGDNGRERPYALLYPRATTKSNVFTVYVRAQSIRKSKSADITEFDEEKDQVTGEYRGSTTVERFLDPNDKALLKYDVVNNKEGLDKYYRFRVVNTKRFSP